MDHQNNHNKDAVKVFFSLTDTEWKWTEESMWALPVGLPDTFKLDNIPLLAYGISRDDVFLAELSEKGVYYFKEVVERGKHSTLRVHFKVEPVDFNIVQQYLKQLQQLGCSYEGNGATLYAIDVPPESDFQKINDLLNKVEELGVWEYEEAYIYKLNK